MPEAPDSILKLVDQFHENREQYMISNYNEEQARAEFINPLLEALGWDVRNKSGYSPAYMDVVFEGTIRTEGNANAPDYTFRVGQKRMFFVEAKKPAVSINFDPEPARQIRRYSWTAKLPLGIATNFHELAVYDGRIPPKPADKASYARLIYMKYTDYADRWDEIASIFSRDAVWKGSFDRYAQKDKGKTGTAEVDSAFLKQIEEWRLLLARNLALRNRTLSVRELNYAVQSTIDRIVFLRICEDRGIEEAGQLLGMTNGPNTHRKLVDLYYKADDRYNSGLFHFRQDKTRREAPDDFTPGLVIDDKALKEIIGGLYYPKSPYAFSVIGAEILGNVYEQFLGKVISLTPGHKALVEEKPEVKKAGGVYYTPSYIVDYIVKNTVGKLCEGKTPKQVEKLRILDPACGSGSFLINAYAWLLNWHLDYYVTDGVEKHKKVVYSIPGGGWRLATKEKKRILLNNVYGVDIDSQAVEVTKLSLLLKVLEGESAETLDNQLKLLHERALPDLSENIKCGNSLIGTDFDISGLSEDEVRRINPFDWNTGFPEIMKNGGFDAVIGNPPYVRPHNIPQETKELLWDYFTTFAAKSDMYSCFMERGCTLTRPGGLFSFIVPQTWTSLESFTKIREFIYRNSHIHSLVQLPKKVFRTATVETCIFIVERAPQRKDNDTDEITVERLDQASGVRFERRFPQSDIAHGHLYNFQLYGREDSRIIIDRLEKQGNPLAEYVSFVYGFKTGDDERFIHTTKRYEESKPFIHSGAIRRYWHESAGHYVWYVPSDMRENKSTARPGEAARFEAEKIIVARMGKSLVATYDPGGLYVKDAMLLLGKGNEHSLIYILGILNSRLMTYFYSKFFITIDVLKNALLSLPIRTIDFNNPEDKARHDKMVELVDRMLDLHKKLATANIPGDKTHIERQIASTDREIDKLVYELYGLTEDEIKIVEGDV